MTIKKLSVLSVTKLCSVSIKKNVKAVKIAFLNLELATAVYVGDISKDGRRRGEKTASGGR